MTVRADVTPNRRGMKSRELVLDAAERVMAEHGFEAATLACVVAEAGIPMSSGDGEIQAVVWRIREHALDLLRAQIAIAFGDDPRNPVTDQLARFALAAIDGAFVAIQADHGATLERLLEPLAPSLVASRQALLAGEGREGRRATESRT